MLCISFSDFTYVVFADHLYVMYQGVLGYTEEPLASCDFNHDPHSGVVDASQTRVSQQKLVKVLIWFDNEWGYANRMLDTLHYWCARQL